jgi:uncharacterized protein YjbJ (UPF0337 family)
MGELNDKIKGTTNDAVGNLKQAVGKALGNEELQAKGLAQEAKGEAQKVVGSVKGAAGDKI